MSTAVAYGLYHPRCKDSHTTYFPGIPTADDTWTKEELEAIGLNAKKEARQQYAERQEKRFGRLAENSLDKENQKRYETRREEWKIQKELMTKPIAKATDFGIMELYRKTDDEREGFKFITDEIFNNLTIAARKKGAVIIRGTKEA